MHWSLAFWITLSVLSALIVAIVVCHVPWSRRGALMQTSWTHNGAAEKDAQATRGKDTEQEGESADLFRGDPTRSLTPTRLHLQCTSAWQPTRPFRVWYMILHEKDHDTVEEVIHDTWCSELPLEDARYDLLIGTWQGDSEQTTVGHDVGRHIFSAPVKESRASGCLQKTLYAFRYALDVPGWEYIVRTNNGSYLQHDNVMAELQDVHSTDLVLLGAVNVHHDRPPFVQGYYMVFTRALVKELVTLGVEHVGADDCWLTDRAQELGATVRASSRILLWTREVLTDLPSPEDAACIRLSHPYGYCGSRRINKMYKYHAWRQSVQK